VAHAYDDATRSAVLGALLEGQSVSQVARTYNVSRRAVQLWRDAAGHRRSHVSQEKQSDIDELVAGVLEANLHAVQVLAERIATEEEWFRKQPASDIAVLSGVLTDKAVRILEAVPSASSSDADAAAESPETPDR